LPARRGNGGRNNFLASVQQSGFRNGNEEFFVVARKSRD